MTQAPDFDASIPVLTEVLADEAAPPAPAPAPAAAAASQRALPDWGASDWQALEDRLAERVLQQLQGRIDFVLETRLRDSLGEIVRHALAPLTQEIRAGLHETLTQTVARAVAAEIAHLKAQKH